MNFQKFLYAALLTAPILVACGDDDDNSNSTSAWQTQNETFMGRLESNLSEFGDNAYFSGKVSSQAYPYASTYYHKVRTANEDSLRAVNKWYTPYFTSTLKVHYTLFDTESVLDAMPMDAESFNSTYMDSIFFDSSIKADTLQSYQVLFYSDFTCKDVITGWGDVLQKMHIGDHWIIAVPWQLGYGATGSSDIEGYSSLFFRLELVDITNWGGTQNEN